jgi:hypothetical protein
MYSIYSALFQMVCQAGHNTLIISKIIGILEYDESIKQKTRKV